MINIETNYFIQRLINYLKVSPIYDTDEARQARFEVELGLAKDATCMEKVDLMPSCDATGQPIDIVGIIRNEYLASNRFFYDTPTHRHPLLRGGYIMDWNEATPIIEDEDAFYEMRKRIPAGDCKGMFIFHPSVVADVDAFYEEHGFYDPSREEDYPAPHGLVKCDKCDRLVPRVVAGDFETEWICNTCYEDNVRECEICGEIHWDNDMHYIENDDVWVCGACLDDHYYRCRECNEYVHEDNVHWGNDDEPYCCDECLERASAYDSEDEGEYVKSYSWKPNPQFKGSGDDLFMGIELEVSGQQRHAPEFLSFFGDDYDTYNNVYLKSDCSIQGGGFEIVTHPMTFGYINETFKPMLDKALRHLRREHFAGHNKGGMHIHLSRRAINPDVFLRMYKLLYNEDDKQAWLTVTQRKEDDIDQWAKLDKPCITNEDIVRRYENCYDAVLGARYNALNVTDHTVELRIFNSNLRLERVLKNVECAKAIVEFSKTERLCKFSSFANFVHENKETYPNLDAFLQERGYNFSAKAFTGAVADDTTESNRELVVDPVEIPY